MLKNFAQELKHELAKRDAHSFDDKVHGTGRYIEKVVVAEAQVDLYMAAKIVNGELVMVMSRDCDILILSGDCCIAMKGFAKGQYELVSTSETTLKNAMIYLSTKPNAKFVPARIHSLTLYI